MTQAKPQLLPSAARWSGCRPGSGNGATERPSLERETWTGTHYNFRCRATGSGKYIEVPKGLVLEETDLGWIKGCDYEIGADGDRTGPLEMTDEGMVRGGIRPGEDPIGGKGEPVLGVPIPSVVLVPLGPASLGGRADAVRRCRFRSAMMRVAPPQGQVVDGTRRIARDGDSEPWARAPVTFRTDRAQGIFG